MNNELKIKPLLEYRVEWGNGTHIKFTADSHSDDGEKLTFFRTGNVIREIYHKNDPVTQLIVTPVEQGE